MLYVNHTVKLSTTHSLGESYTIVRLSQFHFLSSPPLLVKVFQWAQFRGIELRFWVV